MRDNIKMINERLEMKNRGYLSSSKGQTLIEFVLALGAAVAVL